MLKFKIIGLLSAVVLSMCITGCSNNSAGNDIGKLFDGNGDRATEEGRHNNTADTDRADNDSKDSSIGSEIGKDLGNGVKDVQRAVGDGIDDGLDAVGDVNDAVFDVNNDQNSDPNNARSRTGSNAVGGVPAPGNNDAYSGGDNAGSSVTGAA